MKKILETLVLVMAMNFVAVAALFGWLVGGGHLTRDRWGEVRNVLFPGPTSQPATATAPAEAERGPAALKLEDLLAKSAGRPASEQVEYIQNAFDQQMAQLDRRQRELVDLKGQVELARRQLSSDRVELGTRSKQIEAKETEAARLEGDAGFQASLALYASMPPAQVKKVFMGLDDATVTRYLQAMQPRMAAKVMKEFKSPDETTRASALLERIRRADTSPAVPPAAPAKVN